MLVGATLGSEDMKSENVLKVRKNVWSLWNSIGHTMSPNVLLA
jgi:hypothetical protein